MILAFVALLASITPASKTSWMRPDLFHLVIGMPRAVALKTLTENGWKTQPGEDKDHVVVDYSDEKSVTLRFRKDRLSAISFELFALVPVAQSAFAEQKEVLQEKFGAPRRTLPSIVLYDNRLPNVMVVLNADPKSEHGRRGLGMLVVRYYDPR
jgi:hypothetical protein